MRYSAPLFDSGPGKEGCSSSFSIASWSSSLRGLLTNIPLFQALNLPVSFLARIEGKPVMPGYALYFGCVSRAATRVRGIVRICLREPVLKDIQSSVGGDEVLEMLFVLY